MVIILLCNYQHLRYYGVDIINKESEYSYLIARIKLRLTTPDIHHAYIHYTYTE